MWEQTIDFCYQIHGRHSHVSLRENVYILAGKGVEIYITCQVCNYLSGSDLINSDGEIKQLLQTNKCA